MGNKVSGGMKRRARRGRITGWLAMGFLAVVVAGCARPDWIEQTLVTVDVTGVWRGTYLRVGGSGNLELTLQQSGPKVTGRATSAGQFIGAINGAIEGTVSGDTLRFRDSRGRVIGEAQVNGDEMTGSATTQYGPGVTIQLRWQQ